jgi:hypothetical protein
VVTFLTPLAAKKEVGIINIQSKKK